MVSVDYDDGWFVSFLRMMFGRVGKGGLFFDTRNKKLRILSGVSCFLFP